MTLIFAHRGSKGTHPENTMSAFKEAIEVKADGIELDVQFSLDKELVVIHDGDVKRTTNGTGLVKELTLKQLKELDAGSWFNEAYKEEKIPSFEEVLELLSIEKYQGILNVELKTDEYDYEGIELKVLESLKKYPLDCQIILSSFNIETMKRVVSLDDSYEKSIILEQSEAKVIFGIEEEKIDGIHPSIKWVKKNIECVLNSNKKIRPWTVNSDEDIAMCFELKLDGFHTDYPKKAMALKVK